MLGGAGRKQVMSQENIGPVGPTADQTFQHPTVQFTTDDMDIGPVGNKTIRLHFTEKVEEKDKKTKELKMVQKPIGIATIKLRDLVEQRTSGQTLQFTIMHHSSTSKPIGATQISNFSIKDYQTFLDLYTKQGLNIVPVVAVDFSLSNLTFDEQRCIHSLKKDQQNDYVDTLKSIGRAYTRFSKFYLGYGFGAKTVKAGDLSK